jgi:hypothetical protein
MWAAAAGAPWGSATPEQSAFRPQAADAAIAVLMTATVRRRPPLGYPWGYPWISKDILWILHLSNNAGTLDIDSDILWVSGMEFLFG